MTLDEKLEEIISKCKRAERPFLYIMVFICMITSCDNNEKLKAIMTKINSLEFNIGK